MVELKPEQKLIFLLSRRNPSAEVMAEARNIIGDSNLSIDYSYLIGLSEENEVASLLYHNTQEVVQVPDTALIRLQNAYHCAIRHNVLNATEVMKVINLLKNDGIEAIALKGSIASDIIFGDIGLYPSSDIDILVEPRALKKADKILTAAGYRKDEGISEQDLLTAHYHLLYRKGRHYLELHWNLVRRYFSVPADFWWEERQNIPYEETEIIMLSPERYILYTVFRLFDH